MRDLCWSVVARSYTEGSQVLENFTKVMILHPIAGALSLLAVIMGLVSLRVGVGLVSSDIEANILLALPCSLARSRYRSCSARSQLGVGLASRTCTILMSLSAFLALLAALVALAIDLALWIIVRNRIRDRGYEAELGNANWLTVGAVAALILGTCTAACGSCGRFATGRMGGEKY